MARVSRRAEHWKQRPDKHDYPAAEEYLSLITSPSEAKSLARGLRTAPIVKRKAKDLLRSSALPLLAADNFDVAKNLKKVAEGKLLSPVLCVRGIARMSVPLIVADGYHRICASYHVNEDENIPVRLIDLKKA